MIDGHVHFEDQPYTLEIVWEMVEYALKNKIDELYLVDHTHKFVEFVDIYKPLFINEINKNWYDHLAKVSINDYLSFIKEIKNISFPLKLKFGLEVCYIEKSEQLLREQLNKYDFDFLIGSIHHIDSFPFDLNKDIWVNQDVDFLYRRYYELMKKLIKSQLFPILGHPDSIKLYNYYPSYDLEPTYQEIAILLREAKMLTENNSGLIRYGFSYPGLNPLLLKTFKNNNIPLLLSSDAHQASDIGRAFLALNSLM